MTKSQRFGFTTAGMCVVTLLAGCGGGGGDYNFNLLGVDRYVRVDRTGNPALASALLSRVNGNPVPVDGNTTTVNPGAGNVFNSFDNQRDAFNRGDPVNDARDFAFMMTVGPQVNALANYHFKLGPQLRSLSLVPCSRETVVQPRSISDIDLTTCATQVAPVIFPDVLTLDPNVTASWPNGRTFDDPVVDRLLAAALLDITSAPGQTLNSLVGVINPVTDETGTASPAKFPHLRAAHPSP
jgi:hypothetical protein